MEKVTPVIALHEHGEPRDVLRYENWQLLNLDPHQVVVDTLASPVNPADINIIEGTYPLLPDLPAKIGNEGVGVVLKIGADVKDIKIGDHVIAPGRAGWWCEADIIDADRLVVVPPSIDPQQACLLSVNPPTAWLMLHEFVSLSPGDWVLQNAANSAVGRCVIRFAKHLGLRTINVVRREEVANDLVASGADSVVLEGSGYEKEVSSLTGGALPRLALNAVGGESLRTMAKAVAQGGTLVTYGAMSRSPVSIGNGMLIFKNLNFTGFWITNWYQQAGKEAIERLFEQLLPLAVGGLTDVPVEQAYPLKRIHEAIEHAARPGREGKIILEPRMHTEEEA